MIHPDPIVVLMQERLAETVQTFLADHAASQDQPVKIRKLGVADLLKVDIDDESQSLVDQATELVGTLKDSLDFTEGNEAAFARLAVLFQQTADSFVKLSEDWAPSLTSVVSLPDGTKRNPEELASQRKDCKAMLDSLLTIARIEPTPDNLDIIKEMTGIPVIVSYQGRGEGGTVQLDLPRIRIEKPEKVGTAAKLKKDSNLMTIVVDGIAMHQKDSPTYSLNRETMDAFGIPSREFLESYWAQGGRALGKAIDYQMNERSFKVSVHPV